MEQPQEGTRIPRPMGSTEKGYYYSKTQKQEDLNKLQNHIVQHYITNNFNYCERHYNIEQLSILINLPTSHILKHTIDYGHNIQANMDRLTSGESLRAVLALGIQASLEDRGRAIEQYSILRASQGNGYKAFISGEVNKALKLVMETGTNIASITKSMGTGNNLNVLINGAQQGNEDNAQQGVNVDEAIMLIKESGIVPLGLNPVGQEKIFIDHQIEDMPEVCALKQEGVDTSKEALNLNTLTDFDDQEDHTDRRAKEEGLNTEEVI